FPISKYVEIGRQLGHAVAIYGEQTNELPHLPHSLDAKSFDAALFVVYEPWDFPDMPYLARLLDNIPKERRFLIDCCGRYNDTIRVEHDFNHLEKMDRHQGWEWVEGFDAVAGTILQPTLKPLRSNVQPFLWHAYDPNSVVKPYGTTEEAVAAWANTNGNAKAYGMTYVGHSGQRWTRIRRLLEAVEPLSSVFGRIALAGSDWEKRPQWAADLGIQGIDVDPDLMARTQTETKPPIA